jgi:hypothetical protein
MAGDRHGDENAGRSEQHIARMSTTEQTHIRKSDTMIACG